MTQSVQTSFRKLRGYHYWLCLRCGRVSSQFIPDQADDRYSHNPQNPWLGLCADCSKGYPHCAIRLGNHTVKTQPIPAGNGVSHALPEDWARWEVVAKRYARKAYYQDREDVRHNILLRLYMVAKRKEAEGEAFTDVAMFRTASLVVMDWWHEMKRNGRIISLDLQLGEFDQTLADTVPDDRAIDLVEWLDAKTWLLGCPKRLIEVATKRVKGTTLSENDKKYLLRYRRKAQMSLFPLLKTHT